MSKTTLKFPLNHKVEKLPPPQLRRISGYTAPIWTRPGSKEFCANSKKWLFFLPYYYYGQDLAISGRFDQPFLRYSCLKLKYSSAKTTQARGMGRH